MGHKVRSPAGDEVAARLATHEGSGKLVSIDRPRHKQAMRYLILAALLFVAACAPRPAATPVPQPVAPTPVSTGLHDHRTVNGMTAGELIQHFGKPRLQIVEGDGTKLQFAGPNCVLDIYLYPPSGSSGTPRATYIEARNLQGGDVSAQSCAASIENR
jgi:hypothetical protein